MKNPLGKNYLLIVIVIVTLSSIIPALMITGFIEKIIIPGYEVATIIAIGGGILAGAFITTHRIFTIKGMLLGLIFNLGVLWATILYTQVRTSILRIEIVVPLILGSLPAIMVYFVFFKKKK